jgi:zinc metalloprotease ZmpB
MMDSQMTPFDFGGSVEAGSIGEGFGDYWAVTVSNVIAPTPDPACVADWDSVSYTIQTPHCLRRVDLDLHYPEDLNGLVHHEGQIWSRALWDIRNSLGHVTADTLILEGQFGFAPDTSMPAAALATVNAANNLYGPAVANVVRSAFQARGILP